jgi:hypothetical protein
MRIQAEENLIKMAKIACERIDSGLALGERLDLSPLKQAISELEEVAVTEPLKDEELRRDVADLLRQFTHVNVPLEECSQVHKAALLNSATFVLQLIDRHGYIKGY